MNRKQNRKKILLALCMTLLFCMTSANVYAEQKTTEEQAQTKQTKPEKTKMKKIAVKSPQKMKLYWKSVKGASGYQIYRSEKKDGAYKKIEEVKGKDTCTYTDKKVRAGKTYYYKVRAIKKKNGEVIKGSFSPVMKGRTVAKTNVTSVKTTSPKEISVKWKQVKNASGYEIYRSTKKNSGYQKIGKVNKNTTKFKDKNVKIGKKYYYKVVTLGSLNGEKINSGYSDEVKYHFTKESTYYEIMGKSSVTAKQMAALYKSSGRKYPSHIYKEKGAKNIEKFCEIILDECKKEGVKAEVIFAQVCLETGYLQFGGQVSAEQCNFCGLGATDDGAAGATFANVRTGIRAQIQHLKGYASKDKLNQKCVDPRFIYLTFRRGTAKYVQNLGNGNWATDPLYAPKLMNLIQNMKKK